MTLGRVIIGRDLGLLLIVITKGTVDSFDDTGGCAFIDIEDADEGVFFHMEDVGSPALEEGTEIEFDIEQVPTGPRAERRLCLKRYTSLPDGKHHSKPGLRNDAPNSRSFGFRSIRTRVAPDSVSMNGSVDPRIVPE